MKPSEEQLPFDEILFRNNLMPAVSAHAILSPLKPHLQVFFVLLNDEPLISQHPSSLQKGTPRLSHKGACSDPLLKLLTKTAISNVCPSLLTLFALFP